MAKRFLHVSKETRLRYFSFPTFSLITKVLHPSSAVSNRSPVGTHESIKKLYDLVEYNKGYALYDGRCACISDCISLHSIVSFARGQIFFYFSSYLWVLFFLSMNLKFDLQLCETWNRMFMSSETLYYWCQLEDHCWAWTRH